MYTIYIVRHGETENNKKRVLQGRSNLPMNDVGIGQAEKVREYFTDQGIRFDKVYSSPLIRAVQTARVIIGEEPGGAATEDGAAEMPAGAAEAPAGSAEATGGADDAAAIVLDDQLLEMDYGPYEGCSLLDPPKEIIEFFSDFVNNPAPEGMENLSDLVVRMGGFMEGLTGRFKEGSNDGSDKTILISTHAIAMKGILEYLTPQSHGFYWNKHIANCAVYKTTLSNGEFTVPEEVLE